MHAARIDHNVIDNPLGDPMNDLAHRTVTRAASFTPPATGAEELLDPPQLGDQLQGGGLNM
ncbi:hypothetical protein [Nonomuraea guangzhouensis]|uniref:Uncharacterized protein n=1 Tax=Nonomuraea guangzhouensis TaxID=1291555 RepID=A0ABW4GB01_9ACTN|nr:hypothetical protein [Nonomuraea guangzhouensis]